MRGRRIGWTLLLLAGLALSLMALVQVADRAERGRQALLKWRPDFEALARGEDVYRPLDLSRPRDEAEGYPTLPLSALVLAPLLELGPVTGCLVLGAVKVAIAWFVVAAALRLAAGRARDFSPWTALFVLALCARPMMSDLAHGNLNLLVGGCVVASAVAWRRGHDLRAGLWAALGATLKVTPALLLLYFAWKRSPRALAGFAAGLLVFVLALPSVALGPERALALSASWAEQMVWPVVSGAPLTVVQTEQTNQSLLGVAARWLTESVAIRARPPVHPSDVSIAVAALSRAELQLVLAMATAVVIAWLAACTPRRTPVRDSTAVLGEFALLSLAMNALSERSWKHHWVLLALPIAFLAWELGRAEAPRAGKRTALAALIWTALCFGATGSGVLGDRASDYAEAWGAFLAGGLALLAATGVALRERARAASTPA